MKSIAFLGTNGGVSFSELGFERALDKIGQNTGNAMFQYALWQRTINPKITVDVGDDAQMIRDSAEVLLIPAANQINPAWDLSPWADFIERVNLPLVVIGLGAQADIDGSPKLKLQPGTERFIKLASERCSTIGVRGLFTQQVLAEHGIYNTAVTGCPSQHINAAVAGASISEKLEKAKSGNSKKVGYVFGTMEEVTRNAESRLFQVAKQCNAQIIYQTNRLVLRYLFDGYLDSAAQKYFSWESSVLSKGMLLEDYLSEISCRGRFFSDARTWIDSMRSFDIVFGMRIHGAVAAIQGGGLGICVAFDSRTLELAQTMGYPYITSAEAEKVSSVADVAQRTVFDQPRFDHLRVVHRRAIEKILSESGCALRKYPAAAQVE